MPDLSIVFDPMTGLPTGFMSRRAKGNSKYVNLLELPVDERNVFLLTGPVHYSLLATMKDSEPHGLGELVAPKSVSWPPHSDAEPLVYTIADDEKPWEIELPQKCLDEIRLRLVKIDAPISDDSTETKADRK
jgi:hypothetical protein